MFFAQMVTFDTAFSDKQPIGLDWTPANNGIKGEDEW